MKEHLVVSLVAYVLTLSFKGFIYTKFDSKFPWYSLEMIFKGAHNFMVTAVGHSVKWPRGDQIYCDYLKLG